MFERFTDRARLALVAAREESRRLNHGHVGTEHVLLGLAAGDGIAAKALQQVAFDPDRFEHALLAEVPRGVDVPPGHIPFTPRSKKALERGLRQALAWGHTYIGTEHLLLGLLHDDSALAARLTAEQGISREAIVAVVVELLADAGVDTATEPAPASAARDLAREAVAIALEAERSEAPGARCPSCREALANNLAADLILSNGEVERMFAVAYCSACGHTLTVVPDS